MGEQTAHTYKFSREAPEAESSSIFGVEILAGKLKSKASLINEEGKDIGKIKSIEDQGEKIKNATRGEQGAISVTGLTIRRQANKGHELYTAISEENYRAFKKKKHLLSKSEVDVLKQIAKIMRKNNELWGI